MAIRRLLTSGIVLTVGLAAGLSVALLAPSCGTAVTGVEFDPAAPTFPNVQGDNLNGRGVKLPSGADAPFAIIMVGFYEPQQDQINTWLPTARELADQFPNVEYYELPVLNSGAAMVRGFIDGGMRRGIPQTAARERTITIYTDREEFRRLAGIARDDQAWIGVVDRAGRVYWSALGSARPDQLVQLSSVVMQLASPGAAR